MVRAVVRVGVWIISAIRLRVGALIRVGVMVNVGVRIGVGLGLKCGWVRVRVGVRLRSRRLG